MQKVLSCDIDKMKFHQSLDLRMASSHSNEIISSNPNGQVGEESVSLSDRLSLINGNIIDNVNNNNDIEINMNNDNNSTNSFTTSNSSSTSGNSSNNNVNNLNKTEQNELRIIIIDENWSQYCYRIKVNTPFGKLINRFCQQVKKIDNKSVLFWYQGKNVEDDDTPRTLQVKDGEVIFAHYIKT